MHRRVGQWLAATVVAATLLALPAVAAGAPQPPTLTSVPNGWALQPWEQLAATFEDDSGDRGVVVYELCPQASITLPPGGWTPGDCPVGLQHGMTYGLVNAGDPTAFEPTAPLVTGTAYAWHAKSVDEFGAASPWSPPEDFSFDPSAPSPPANFHVVHRSDTTVEIAWNASVDPNSGVSTYQIQESPDGDPLSWGNAIGGTCSAPAGGGPFTSTCTYALPGTQVHLRIRAVDVAGNESAWKTISTTTGVRYSLLTTPTATVTNGTLRKADLGVGGIDVSTEVDVSSAGWYLMQPQVSNTVPSGAPADPKDPETPLGGWLVEDELIGFAAGGPVEMNLQLTGSGVTGTGAVRCYGWVVEHDGAGGITGPGVPLGWDEPVLDPFAGDGTNQYTCRFPTEAPPFEADDHAVYVEVWVRADTGDGTVAMTIGDGSSYVTASRAATGPPPPPTTLNFPANASRYAGTGIDATYPAAGQLGVLEYEVWSAPGVGGGTVVDAGPVKVGSLGTNATYDLQAPYAFTPLWTPGDTYTWRVRTRDVYGRTSTWAGLRTFVINDRPATPGNNGTLPATGDTTPTLLATAYSDDPDSTHTQSIWEVRTANGSYATPVYFNASGSDLTSHTVAVPLADGAYYWRVRYVDDQGVESLRGPDIALNIDTSAPSPPATVEDGAGPGDSAWTKVEDELKGTWSDESASGAAGYAYCFTTTADCTGSVTGSTATTISTSVTLSGLAPLAEDGATTYRLCVASVDAAQNASAYSCSNGQKYDGTNPTGTIGYGDGAYPNSYVDVNHTEADTLSNVATWKLERDNAPLNVGTCDPLPGTWANPQVDPANPWRDTSLADDTCYAYRLVITDTAGNVGTITSTDVLEVDHGAFSVALDSVTSTAGPAYQFLVGSTLYFNPEQDGGFGVTVTASSPNGIQNVLFPDPSAATGWSGGTTDNTATNGDEYSASFAWDGTPVTAGEPGTITLTATDNALATATTDIDVLADADDPTGSVTYPDGPISVTNEDIAFTQADALSGTKTWVLERQDGSFVGGACQDWGANGNSDWTAIATDPAVSPVSDTTLQDGQCYKYRLNVTDNVGHVATFTNPNVLEVGTGSPTVTFNSWAVGTNPTFQHAVGEKMFFNPAESGDFDLLIDVVDNVSGAKQVVFPALGAGWTPAAAAPALTDTSGTPFAVTYAWSSAPANPGTITVTGSNNSLLTATEDVDIVADGSAPTGTLSYGNGITVESESTLTFTVDDNLGSGVAGWTIERDETTFDGTSCGIFPGTWSTPVGNPSEPSTYTDTSLVDGNCYKYRLATTDNVGNTSYITSTNITKVFAAALAVSFTGFEPQSGAPYQFAVGNEMFYNPDFPGSFDVLADAVVPAPNSIDHVTFPDLAATGWTGTGTETAPTLGSTYRYASYSWSTGALDPGQATITAEDSLTNQVTDVFNVTADSAAPTGTIDYPDAYQSATSVQVDTTFADGTGSGIALSKIESTTAPLSDGSCGTYNVNWVAEESPVVTPSMLTAGDGACTKYRLVIKDNVSNYDTITSTHEVKVDSTAPNVSLDSIAPDSHSYVNANTVYYDPDSPGSFDVVVLADDSESGIDDVTFPALGTDWLPATPQAVSGGTFTQTYSWSVGAAEPLDQQVTAANNSALTTTGGDFRVEADSTDPDGTVDYAADALTDLSGGTFEIDFTTNDPSSGTATWTVERDSATLSGGTCGSGDSYGTVVDTDGVSPSVDTTLTDHACYRYRLLVTDNVGRTATIYPTSPLQFMVDTDTTAPDTPADGLGADILWTTDGGSISGNWSGGVDPESGLGHYEYCVARTSDCSQDIDVSWTSTNSTDFTETLPLTEGETYYVCVKSVNGVGADSALACSDGQQVDTTPPVAPIVSDGPAGGEATWLDSASHYTGKWTGAGDTGSGLDHYEYCLSASAGCLSPSSIWTSLPLSEHLVALSGLALSDGTKYYLCVRAHDVAGKTSVGCSDGATVDVTGPQLAVDSQSASLTGNVTVTGTASDLGIGVAAVRVQYDGPNGSEVLCTNATVSSGTWSCPDWNTYLLPNGTYTITVSGVDLLGNAGSATGEIVLANQPTPVANVSVGSHPTTGAVPRLPLRWLASVDGDGTLAARYLIRARKSGSLEWERSWKVDADAVTDSQGRYWQRFTIIAGLEPGASYDFLVIAYDDNGGTSKGTLEEGLKVAPAPAALRLFQRSEDWVQRFSCGANGHACTYSSGSDVFIAGSVYPFSLAHDEDVKLTLAKKSGDDWVTKKTASVQVQDGGGFSGGFNELANGTWRVTASIGTDALETGSAEDYFVIG